MGSLLDRANELVEEYGSRDAYLKAREMEKQSAATERKGITLEAKGKLIAALSHAFPGKAIQWQCDGAGGALWLGVSTEGINGHQLHALAKVSAEVDLLADIQIAGWEINIRF